MRQGEVRNMEVQENNVRDLSVLRFKEEFGLLGSVVLKAFKQNVGVPDDYLEGNEDYYVNMSSDFINQMHNNLCALMALIGNQLAPIGTDRIVKEIMHSLCQTP